MSYLDGFAIVFAPVIFVLILKFIVSVSEIKENKEAK